MWSIPTGTFILCRGQYSSIFLEFYIQGVVFVANWYFELELLPDELLAFSVCYEHRKWKLVLAKRRKLNIQISQLKKKVFNEPTYNVIVFRVFPKNTVFASSHDKAIYYAGNTDLEDYYKAIYLHAADFLLRKANGIIFCVVKYLFLC